MALADGVYVIRAGNARMVGADGVYSPLKTMPACGVPSRWLVKRSSARGTYVFTPINIGGRALAKMSDATVVPTDEDEPAEWLLTELGGNTYAIQDCEIMKAWMLTRQWVSEFVSLAYIDPTNPPPEAQFSFQRV